MFGSLHDSFHCTTVLGKKPQRARCQRRMSQSHCFHYVLHYDDICILRSFYVAPILYFRLCFRPLLVPHLGNIPESVAFNAFQNVLLVSLHLAAAFQVHPWSMQSITVRLGQTLREVVSVVFCCCLIGIYCSFIYY
jgi:hypothetical protein